MRNKELLLAVCSEIKPILDQLVLVGGCATELLVTDTGAPATRPTVDVDMVVKVASLAEYYKLEEQLRDLGFTQTQDDQGVICRWKKADLLLDLMPTDEKILGFTNRWYSLAVEHAEHIIINDVKLSYIPASIFIATKLEAFGSRGESDFMLSHDIEDAVTVIDGRENIVTEIETAPGEIRNFLSKRFELLMKDDRFDEALPGFLPPDIAGQNRLESLIDKLNAISKL